MEKTTMFPIQDVDGPSLAFGGDVKTLMPSWADLPDAYRRGHRNTWAQKLVSDWFFTGVKDLQLTPRDGVDTEKAKRHIKAILMSWEPRHEHKEAGCAWLLDQWFTAGTWTRPKRKSA